MNTKEQLFDAIRHEDVVIWAGAGLSHYAGYPLGNALKMIIYDGLSPEEKVEMSPGSYSLAAMAKEFVRLRGNTNHELFDLIRQIYEKSPESIALHERLAKIPHFKTAITTNYDNLFELAYAGRVNKIVRDSDIPLRRKGNFDVIKFHGDFSAPEKVILSEKDYSRLYNADEGSPLRSLVTSQISAHVVLFLGYGYEDQNVWAIFEKISHYLAGTKKQAFFVAPGMPSQKVGALKHEGITYIDSTAETFLDELTEDIRAHIMDDLQQQKVAPETYRAFLNNYNIEPNLRGAINGFELESLSSVDKGPLKGQLNFNIPDNQAVIQKLDDFFLGNSSNELELTDGQFHSVQIKIQGIALHQPGQVFESINLKRLPSIVYEFKLVFFSEGFYLNGLQAEFYPGLHENNIQLKIHSLNVKLIMTRDARGDMLVKFEYEHDPLYRNTKDELEVFRFLKLAFSGEEGTIFFQNGESFSKHAVFNENEMKRAEAYIDYLEKLKKVEAHFKVRFENFSDPTRGSENVLNTLLAIIDGKAFDLETEDTINFTFNELKPETLATFKTFNKEAKAMKFIYDNHDKFPLHGQVFKFPRKEVIVPSAEVTNLDDLQIGTLATVKIRSRTGVIQEKYLATDEHLH